METLNCEICDTKPYDKTRHDGDEILLVCFECEGELITAEAHAGCDEHPCEECAGDAVVKSWDTYKDECNERGLDPMIEMARTMGE